MHCDVKPKCLTFRFSFNRTFLRISESMLQPGEIIKSGVEADLTIITTRGPYSYSSSSRYGEFILGRGV